MALATIKIKEFKNYGWTISRGRHKLGRVFKIYILDVFKIILNEK